MVIRFEELRQLKDSLPPGSIKAIATDLGLEEETVRNYFGGDHFEHGNIPGLHFEKGINGGYVELDDPTIYNHAKELISSYA